MKLPSFTLRNLFWLVLVAALIITINLPRHEGKVFRFAGFPFTFASWGWGPPLDWFNPVAFVGDAVIGGAVLTLLAFALARTRQPSVKSVPFEPLKEVNEPRYRVSPLLFLGPCLAVLVIIGAAVLLTNYLADNPPPQDAIAPNRIVHIADYHWIPEEQYGVDENEPMTYAAFLDWLETLQQQQMTQIRWLDVREVWVEGQSDETIDEFRQHILGLRSVKLPQADSDDPVDRLIRDTYRRDLLEIGAAGRLLLAGEIDEVLPLEDHETWRAAKPLNGEIDLVANELRERAIVHRLPNRAVIVLGVGHDLRPLIPKDIEYWLLKVDALLE